MTLPLPYINISPYVIPGGNLGPTATVDFAGRPTANWLTGTLTANSVITLANRVAGATLMLQMEQNSTGGYTLGISDGISTQPVLIPTAPTAPFAVFIVCPNPTDIFVTSMSVPGPQGPIGVAGPQGPTGPTGPALGSGASVLGAAYYDPVGAATYSVTGTTFSALDTVHLRASFTAPASGVVTVKYGINVNAAASNQATLGILEGTTVLGVTLGPAPSAGGYITNNTMQGSKQLTGLTGTHNYDLALAADSTGTVTAHCGGGLSVAGYGPGYIEVWG